MSRLSGLAGVAALVCAIAAATPAAAAPPPVVAEAATEVGFATARAHGIITPGPQEAFYRFEYIADAAYRQNVQESRESFAGAIVDASGWLPPAAGAVTLAPLLGESGGIEPGVVYHLRLVAENTDGATIAVAPSFLTPKPLEPIPCFGDNCQVLPPEPRDPTLGTTVAGLGNPKIHYDHYGAKAKPHKAKPKKKKRHRSHQKHKKAGQHQGKAKK